MIARPESGGPHPIPGGQKDTLVKGAVRSNSFSVSAPFSFLHIFIKGGGWAGADIQWLGDAGHQALPWDTGHLAMLVIIGMRGIFLGFLKCFFLQTVEVAWQVGPIPVDDQIGKEVVLRWWSGPQCNDDDDGDVDVDGEVKHNAMMMIVMLVIKIIWLVVMVVKAMITICEQWYSGSRQMSTDMEALWKMEEDLRQTAWAGVSRLPFV